MNDTVAIPALTPQDFTSDQEVRWCPGCGDYAIIKAVRKALAEIGTDTKDVVFVSGIGCAARFPYYMDTYGFHTIHGRAPVDRDRGQARQSRARCLGGLGRRRRALHRRQPHAARAAPQRRSQHPAVQQRDLWPDQGPVLAHLARGHALAVDSARLGRSSASRRPASRWAQARASSPARSIPTRSGSRTSSRRRMRTRGPRSSRSSRTASSTTTARSMLLPSGRRRPRPRYSWSTASR